MENRRELYPLAERVIELAKGQLLVDSQFLCEAVAQLKSKEGQAGICKFSTDGEFLYVDAQRTLEEFRETRTPPVHDYVHSLFHCIFSHPFIGSSVDAGLWSFACDIATERLVRELCGDRPGKLGREIGRVLCDFENRFDIQLLNAETIYAWLRGEGARSIVDEWKGLFCRDDHSPWYASNDAGTEGPAGEEGGNESPCQKNDEKGESEGGAEENGSRDGGDQVSAPCVPRSDKLRLSQVQAQWEETAFNIQVGLSTQLWGDSPGAACLLLSLKRHNRRKFDLREFLRQFTADCEVLKVSEDEFDYIFYTYGLQLYGNMPLIEPLEYGDDRRIREFVIALDTSGSVQGELLRKFVEITHDVLSAAGVFERRIRLYILQCDTRVSHVDKIEQEEDLRKWSHELRLYGGGGTDFRPVFSFVDDLVSGGEITNLGGLLYFTDGFGGYPDYVPEYKTAFLFWENGPAPELVPAWAIQRTVCKEDLV